MRIDDRTPCPLTIHPKKSYFEKTIWGGQSFKDWFLDELSQETVSDGRSQVFKSSCYRFRDPSPTVPFPASDFVMTRQDWHSNSFKAVVDRLFVEDTTYSTMEVYSSRHVDPRKACSSRTCLFLRRSPPGEGHSLVRLPSLIVSFPLVKFCVTLRGLRSYFSL